MRGLSRGFHSVSLAMFFSAIMVSSARAADVAGVVTQIIGAAYAKSTGDTNFRTIRKGEFVNEGTTLKTGPGDKVSITLVNGIEIKINQNTTYTIRPTHPSRRGQGNDTTLNKGQMWFKVLKKGTKFQIKTPLAAASVRGTEGTVQFDNNVMRAQCFEGSFNVIPLKSEEEEVDDARGSPVSAGQLCVVENGRPPEIRTIDQPDPWHEELRSGEGAAVRPQQRTVDVTVETEKGERKNIRLKFRKQ